jgi:hypothetical protein
LTRLVVYFNFLTLYVQIVHLHMAKDQL